MEGGLGLYEEVGRRGGGALVGGLVEGETYSLQRGQS